MMLARVSSMLTTLLSRSRRERFMGRGNGVPGGIRTPNLLIRSLFLGLNIALLKWSQPFRLFSSLTRCYVRSQHERFRADRIRWEWQKWPESGNAQFWQNGHPVLARRHIQAGL